MSGGEINPVMGGALSGRARNADITQSTRRQFQQLGPLQEVEIVAESIVPSPDSSALKILNGGTLKAIAVTKNGHFLSLRFGAATTLLGTSNIILSIGLQIKVAAGDILLFQCDGTNWRLIPVRAPRSEEVVAAATISPAPDVEEIKVEGATPITKITATYRPHFLIIRFGGNVTIKSENNLKLAAAEINATNNDILLLVCNGTNWFQCAPLSANV